MWLIYLVCGSAKGVERKRAIFDGEMPEYTAAYTDLVDKVIRQGVLGFDEEHHIHDHQHHHDDSHLIADVVAKATAADDGGANDIVTAKATAMTVLFVAALVAGLIPIKLSQWFKWENGHTEKGRTGLVVSLLLAFGGGVLLCTTFMHLLPEVKENVERLQATGDLPQFGFHFAELLMCIGFFTMYFIEQCVHAYLHSRDAKQAEAAFRRGVSIRESTLMARRKKISEQQRNGSISIADLIENDAENNKYLSQVEIRPTQGGGKVNGSDHSSSHQHQNHGPNNHGHSHVHLPANKGVDDDIIVSSLRGLLIVLALSVHELFEGLAVGLEGSAANVWYLFGAVAAHKLVLAFCVGVELIVARTQKWLALVYVFTFSVVSPLGIGIGILVSGGESGTTSIVSSILQGLASGTLLYVVFFEILQKDKAGLLQLVAVLFGFGLMFGLQFVCEYCFYQFIV